MSRTSRLAPFPCMTTDNKPRPIDVAEAREVFASARFMSRVEDGPVTADECWLWVGGHDRKGYGLIRAFGRSVRAARISLVAASGNDRPDMQCDHMCNVPACVRPDHLRWLSGPANNRRSDSPTARNARKLHCTVCGWQFGINGRNGRRQCFKCLGDRNALARATRTARGSGSVREHREWLAANGGQSIRNLHAVAEALGVDTDSASAEGSAYALRNGQVEHGLSIPGPRGPLPWRN